MFHDPEHEKAWFIKVATNVCRDMKKFTLKHKTQNINELSDYYHDQEQGYILEQILKPSKKLIKDGQDTISKSSETFEKV